VLFGVKITGLFDVIVGHKFIKGKVLPQIMTAHMFLLYPIRQPLSQTSADAARPWEQVTASYGLPVHS